MHYYLDFERPVAELENKIEELRRLADGRDMNITTEIKKLAQDLRADIFSKITPWQKTMIARHPDRPYTLDYIRLLMEDFIELHGDRRFADDPAIVAGFARFQGVPVAVIGHQKGRGTKERIERNFGQPHPEGYRKALRIMKLAERFGNPVITFIDTPGAYPGIGAEERGQSEAIARNLLEMFRLKIPIIPVIIGEGGSGGALALSVGDRILMLEHSVYSVISPEGCAAILWKKNSNSVGPAEYARASEALKLTAQDILALGVIDEIIPEPLGGAHRDEQKAAEALGSALKR
ncbi:MAG: acetyl-CoA carboxylase carboxyltransferase subunit alpha, partial [Deferribacteres bacterium]|nr:acetyl-CoA carboxylase carboxyltransferase subunit alpha [Deferribacteres bacterium]